MSLEGILSLAFTRDEDEISLNWSGRGLSKDDTSLTVLSKSAFLGRPLFLFDDPTNLA